MYTNKDKLLLTKKYKSEKNSARLSHGDKLERAIHLLYGIVCYQDIDLAMQYYNECITDNPMCEHSALTVLKEDYRAIEQVKRHFTAKRFQKAHSAIQNIKGSYAVVLFIQGTIAEQGLGGNPIDLKQAFECYSKASELGHAEATNALGVMHQTGKAVSVDLIKASELYEKAVSLDSSDAMRNLAILLSKGEGVPTDYPKAISLYRRSVKLGNQKAMFNLGQLYELGKGGLAQSYSEAVRLYKRADNNPRALFALAILFMKGRGVELNYAEALELYKKALDKGNFKAACPLAQLYEKGLGVAQNYKEAHRLYEIAIAHNDPEAMNNLAGLYREGKSGVKNHKQAFELLTRAIRVRKDPKYVYNLAYLHLKGYGVVQDSHKAIVMFEEVKMLCITPKSQPLKAEAQRQIDKLSMETIPGYRTPLFSSASLFSRDNREKRSGADLSPPRQKKERLDDSKATNKVPYEYV